LKTLYYSSGSNIAPNIVGDGATSALTAPPSSCTGSGAGTRHN
jgi:hypothetical protein